MKLLIKLTAATALVAGLLVWPAVSGAGASHDEQVLYQGWTFVGYHGDVIQFFDTVPELVENATLIANWDAETQSWLLWTPTGGAQNDIVAAAPDKIYQVHSTAGTTWHFATVPD